MTSATSWPREASSRRARHGPYSIWQRSPLSRMRCSDLACATGIRVWRWRAASGIWLHVGCHGLWVTERQRRRCESPPLRRRRLSTHPVAPPNRSPKNDGGILRPQRRRALFGLPFIVRLLGELGVEQARHGNFPHIERNVVPPVLRCVPFLSAVEPSHAVAVNCGSWCPASQSALRPPRRRQSLRRSRLFGCTQELSSYPDPVASSQPTGACAWRRPNHVPPPPSSGHASR